MPHRTLGVDEVARYLHLDRAEVERLVKDQKIPCERLGARVVFRKLDIDSWASPHILGLQGRRLSEYHERISVGKRDSLAQAAIVPELIQPEWIVDALPAKTKASVIREMVTLAGATGRVWDISRLLMGIIEREGVYSTGLPGGMALLHTRTPETFLIDSTFMVLGRTIQPIPFGAPDGKPTHLFFLIACAADQFHLHVLARLCLMAQKTGLLDGLRGARDREAMFECLIESEIAVLPD
jgi:excisionase family DNA binding protein